MDRSSATKSPFSPQRTDFRSEHTTATTRLSNLSRGKEELKQVEVTQIKDEIRYLSQSDKIEIYRWLDRELVSDLPYRIGSHRSITIRQETERTWKRTVTVSSPKVSEDVPSDNQTDPQAPSICTIARTACLDYQIVHDGNDCSALRSGFRQRAFCPDPSFVNTGVARLKSQRTLSILILDI